MATGTSAQHSIQTVDDFLRSMSKTAAEAHTEPGSIGGPTEHPVKNVDDRTRPATEGARSAENTKDVKADQGKPSVDSTPEAKAAAEIGSLVARFASKAAEGQTGGSAAADQLQIGTNKQPTGEDPKHETSSAKGGKEDGQYQGKSTHPARTDNTELQGGKYAADTSLEKLAEDMREYGDRLCSQLTTLGFDQNQQAPAATAATTAPATKQAASAVSAVDDAWLASQVGWEMAGLITGKFDKRAADALASGTIKEVVKLAHDRAERVIRFYDSHFRALQQAQSKQAAEPAPGGGAADGGGGEAMMAALGGGGTVGGGDQAAAMGGAAGAGQGGGGDQEAMEMAQLLQQLHITPEQLEQILMQIEGGAGGGAGGAEGAAPPPGAGGDAAPMPPAAPAGAPAAAGKAAGDKVANMRDYVLEVISRSRRRAG